ncbi:MAG: hypothetical protein AAFZ07_00515 [Actinomycetota bacterium]
MWRTRAVAVVAVALLAAACSSGGGETAAAPAATSTTSPPPSTAPPTTSPPLSTAPPTTAPRPSAAPPTTVPATSTPSTTTTVAPPTTIAEPVAETDIEVLAAYVEQRSGLTFDEPPEIAFGTVASDELDIDPGLFVDERLWNLFVPLGLVGPDDDRIAAGQARLDQVRGVCCPVVLFETDDHPLLTSVVVVHELTHLLDRQRPLDRRIDTDEDVRFDSIVLEGNAQRVAFDYRDELVAAGALPSRFVFDWAEPRIPDAVLQVLELPYEEGATLSEQLYERGGLPLVEQAFVRPPTTTEQVLDVDAYLDDEQPVEVQLPEPVGVEVTATGTMGAFVLRLLVEQVLDDAAAHDLVTAWGGDRYALFEQGGRPCVVGTVVMDDGGSATDLRDALRGVGVGATIDAETPTAVTVRRCAVPAPVV